MPDETAELLREIERVIKWATEPKFPVRAEIAAVHVSHNRAPEAVRKIVEAMEKARLLRGVRW